VNSKKINLIIIIFAAIAAAIAGLVYFGSLIAYTPNIPIRDDFMDIVPFSLSYASADLTIVDKLYLFLEQHNDHRMLINRIFYAVIFEITGEVDFFLISMAGNLSLIALSILYYRSIKNDKAKILIFFSSIFLLYQISCFAASTFPMTVLSNYWVLAFAFCSLYFLNKETISSRILAILFAFIATFTFASGQFVLIAGLFLLAIKFVEGSNRPSAKSILTWAGASFTILFLFYSGHEERFGNDTIKMVLNSLGFFITGFIKILGAPLAFNNEKIALLVGLLALFVHAYITYRKAWKNYTVFSFSLFLLMSLGIITITRAWAGHDYLITTDRYLFITINYWICLVILGTGFLENRKWMISLVVMLFTLTLNGATYYSNHKEMRKLYIERINNLEKWEKSDRTSRLMIPHRYDSQKANMGLDQLIKLDLYKPPIKYKISHIKVD
jgi:hypothetical protein